MTEPFRSNRTAEAEEDDVRLSPQKNYLLGVDDFNPSVYQWVEGRGRVRQGFRADERTEWGEARDAVLGEVIEIGKGAVVYIFGTGSEDIVLRRLLEPNPQPANFEVGVEV